MTDIEVLIKRIRYLLTRDCHGVGEYVEMVRALPILLNYIDELRKHESKVQ